MLGALRFIEVGVQEALRGRSRGDVAGETNAWTDDDDVVVLTHGDTKDGYEVSSKRDQELDGSSSSLACWSSSIDTLRVVGLCATN